MTAPITADGRAEKDTFVIHNDSRSLAAGHDLSNTESNISHDLKIAESNTTGQTSSSSETTAAGTSALRDKVKSTSGKVQSRAQIYKIRATTPFKFFYPTRILMGVKWQDDRDSSGAGIADGSDQALLWRSRDSRKGRNSIAVPSRSASMAMTTATRPAATTSTSSNIPHRRPRLPSPISSACKTIFRMFTTFPYWSMSFWVAFGYTLGSAVFVINGCFAWLPLGFPDLATFPGQAKYGVGITSCIGVLLFQISAFVAYLETVNEGNFGGSAMRRFLSDDSDTNDFGLGHEQEHEQKEMVDAKLHMFLHHLDPRHHGQTREAVDPESGWKTKDLLPTPAPETKDLLPPRRGALDYGSSASDEVGSSYTLPPATFVFLPSLHNLSHYHIHSIGFLACSVQLIGTTIFVVTGIVALPGILETLTQWQLNAAYWIPQIIASACFIAASLLFMLETQEKWWRPEVKTLGWWVGSWSLVGSLGFMLCGALGPAYLNPTAVYHSSLSSLWGSAAFLVSSLIQWFEVADRMGAVERQRAGEGEEGDPWVGC